MRASWLAACVGSYLVGWLLAPAFATVPERNGSLSPGSGQSAEMRAEPVVIYPGQAPGLPVYVPAVLFPSFPEPAQLAPAAEPAVEAQGMEQANAMALVTPLPTPWARPLTEAEMRAVLLEAGWPVGVDTEEALSVSFGESVGWRPWAVGDGGTSFGLFQLKQAQFNGAGEMVWQGWFRYCGEPEAEWRDPVVNARVARCAFEYEQARGYPRWSNWSVKP